MKNSSSYRVLHICNYAANYRGNFIDSLESLEQYHSNVRNLYLFPERAQNTSAKEWIRDLNYEKEIAYIQKKNPLSNALQLVRIIKKHNINRIVTHFADNQMDILIRLFFDGRKVIRFFHSGCMPASNAGKQRVKDFLYKNNKLVGVSSAASDQISAVFPAFSPYTIENAIHFNRLDTIDEFQKSEGISLLVMGWDYRIKGIDLAIKAAHALRKNIILPCRSLVEETKRKSKNWSGIFWERMISGSVICHKQTTSVHIMRQMTFS